MNLSEEKILLLRRLLTRQAKRGVTDTAELRRILALPRRCWERETSLVQDLTEYLRSPSGKQTLRVIQARSLEELHDLGGLFGPIPVGDGKTLITYLAPIVLEAERPLLVVPAKLREKTRRDFHELSAHWCSCKVQIVSYEKLSRESGTAVLTACKPDLLMFDEAHRLKNRSAAVTRRIGVYMAEHPEAYVLALSGTITCRSLFDFAHVLRWCLPERFYPLPRSYRELEAWAAAVDEIKPYENRMSTSPGALALFCNDEEKKQGRNGIRSAVRRRIQETLGVVAAAPVEVPASLNIVLTRIDGYNAETERLAQGLNVGVKPNGEVITDNDLASRWRNFRTLTSGFWYDWDPRPPEAWLKARFAWKKTARHYLMEHTKGLESEALVASRAASGALGLGAQADHKAWADLRGSYKPNVVPVWVDDRMIRAIATWTSKHSGIVWVSEVALGQRLEKELGLSYFREMGRDSKGRFIEEAEPRGCIVASIASNSEGRNLQAWNDNLVTTPMPFGLGWEQLLGRTHRQGQEADEVWTEVFFGCQVEWNCWVQANKDALYASQIEFPKRLTYASVEKTFRGGGGALWV